MGQQQLLLILVVTIIVAMATILAINTMQDSHEQANHEAIRQKMLDATTLAQAYYRKNVSMGGGGMSYENITLEHLNIEPSNQLGEFTISDQSAESFTLTAIPAAGNETDIVATIYKDDVQITEVPKE
jgi:Tfp pilus assembly protein PilE